MRVVLDLRRVLTCDLFSLVSELVEIKLHQIIDQIVHLFLVILESLAVYDLLVFQVLQEVSQILNCFIILLHL